jgi:transposase
MNRLSDILNYENVTIQEIVKTLQTDLTSDKELTKLILNVVYPKKTKKEIIEDLESYIEKPKMTKKEEKENKNKIEEILKKIYINVLKTMESYLKEEKPMVIVLDNYTVHHALLFKEACEYLNIILIYLPSYSPKLNPIEQIWRTVKNELSTEFIVDKGFLIENFERIFYENVDKKSFTEKWVNEYIHDKNHDLLIVDMCEIAVLPA